MGRWLGTNGWIGCFAAACAVLLTAEAARAEEKLAPAERVARANAALAAGNYDQALDDYREAEVAMPDAPALAYNEAIAYYRKRDFAKARELFGKALATRDLGLEARAKFNLGNCAYAAALEKMTNLQEAIDQLRTAISHYRDTLDVDPNDTDAKANIETAQLLIKDLLDKLKKQQEEQQKNPSSQPNDQQQQNQQQEQQKQDQDQQNASSQPSQDQQQQDQQKQDQQQAGQDQQSEAEKQEGEQKAGEPQDKRQLSEEEAKRLLQAVRDKEQKRRDEQTRRQHLGRPKVDKDW